MQLRKLQKTMLYIALIGTLLWLGGSIIRTAIAFDMFVPGTLVFRTDLSDGQMWYAIYIYTQTYFYTFIGYIMALAGFVPLFLSLRKVWKTHAWLFMAGVLFFLYIPVEILHIYYDSMLLTIVLEGSVETSLEAAKQHVFARFDDLQIFSFLALLSYLSAIVLLVWRPLEGRPQRTQSEDNQGEREPESGRP